MTCGGKRKKRLIDHALIGPKWSSSRINTRYKIKNWMEWKSPREDHHHSTLKPSLQTMPTYCDKDIPSKCTNCSLLETNLKPCWNDEDNNH